MKRTKENLQNMGIEQNYCEGDYEDCMIVDECKYSEECEAENEEYQKEK